VELPVGFEQRALRLDDAAAVAALVAAQELADTGEEIADEADVVADWQRPSFDIAANTVGVFEHGVLVAYAELTFPERCFVAVRPDRRGRGLGTALALWGQARARELGSTIVGMPVPSGSAGEQLLTGLGYHVRWTSWVLRVPPDAELPDRPLPAGYAIRIAASEADRRAVWTTIEDAFLEWSARERQSFEDFDARVSGRPGFEPWHLRMVVDEGGSVAAAASLVVAGRLAYINAIATRRDLRNRGLAQALLADSFRAAREHGSTRCELSTDSRTGALGLYEKIGMEVTETWPHLAKKL